MKIIKNYEYDELHDLCFRRTTVLAEFRFSNKIAMLAKFGRNDNPKYL